MSDTALLCRMGRTVWIVSAFAFFAITGCRTLPTSPRSSEWRPTKVDEAALVDHLLRSEFTDSITNGITLVIEERLSFAEPLWDENMAAFTTNLIRQAESQDKRLGEATRDFCGKNLRSCTVDTLEPLAVKHIVLTEQQIADLFQSAEDGWDAFYKMHPKCPGIITLSRPGFSADGTIAVIYMGSQGGSLAGGGRISVFEKKDGKWIQAYWDLGGAWVS